MNSIATDFSFQLCDVVFFCEVIMLIGLIGLKQSGKDTIADYLVNEYFFEKLAFADPLKRVCKELFDLEESYFSDPSMKEAVVERWGISPRTMMQRVGTDIVRTHFGNDFWIRHMECRLKKLPPSTRVVISDVRFVSEAMFVKSHGGVLMRLKRQSSESDASDNDHISEMEQLIIQEDTTVFNFGTKDDLYQQLDDQLTSILASHALEIV